MVAEISRAKRGDAHGYRAEAFLALGFRGSERLGEDAAAGTTLVFAANPFERRLRDINSVAQQLQGRRSHFETVGKYLLGLEAEPLFL